MVLIIVLLAIWLALVIIGFAIKTLLWLAIVGIVLFVVTGIYGAIRSRIS
jgi:apolipoprotein N-acyltransferase